MFPIVQILLLSTTIRLAYLSQGVIREFHGGRKVWPAKEETNFAESSPLALRTSIAARGGSGEAQKSVLV